MKKGLKVFLVVIIVVPLVIELLIQLFTPYFDSQTINMDKMHPTSQPGTIWQSEDGKMTFTTQKTIGGIPLAIETDDGIIEIGMSIRPITTDVIFYNLFDESSDEQVAKTLVLGSGLPKDYDKFVIKIISIHTDDPTLGSLFEENKKIVFYRISVPESAESVKTGDG